MRLAPNRPSGLMASTPDEASFAGGRGERTRSSSDSRGGDPGRLDDLRRARDLGRADRARTGRPGRQRVRSRGPRVARLPRLVRRHRADLPRGRGGRRATVQARMASQSLDRRRLVRRALLRLHGVGPLGARLVRGRRPDRRDRALDNEPRRRLRRLGRDRAQPDADRQADHVGDLRHGLRHRGRALDPLHQAQPLDRRLRRRLRCIGVRAAAPLAVVLRPLRQPRDRARDQARLRLPVPTHVAWGQGPLARRPARVRARTRALQSLRHAPHRAAAAARRRLRLPDAALFHQGRDERLRLRSLGEPRCAGAAFCGEAGAQARRRLSARPPLLRPARSLHDLADVDRAHLRHHLLALRPPSGDHRRDAVLAARRRRRPLRDRPDRDRATLLPALRGRGSPPRRADYDRRAAY